ncbi:Phage protein [Fusobacterium necrophorum subsp. funduliforme]|uniref:hypothetical protein n=1 Tax=Fusobacterium necrophorum TaxID=859 RepID=UPI000245DC8A|nr:hypothetical protein [Fusobacterium necrophorum]AVQ21349.1 hypothetical protein C4N15_06725 [Fusobacterium necrophorum subsp. funduliforme]EHO19791.1 hypothetical protein HMPREF9466_01722 [Fusobacterium necrophorum subsp. funduliforme 1_1_36S]
MHWKELQNIVKIAFQKNLEDLVDLTTGNWKCGTCKEKAKFLDKELILKALKEKENEIKQQDDFYQKR